MHIRTQRCLLRPVTLPDAAVLHDALGQEGFVKGMLHKRHIHGLTDAQAYTQNMVDGWSTGTSYFFSVVLPDDDRCIGRIGVSRKPDGEWHMAYWIHPLWQGKGYASECMQPALEAAFALTKADAIVAQCHEWNLPSRHLLETQMSCIHKGGELWTFTVGRPG